MNNYRHISIHSLSLAAVAFGFATAALPARANNPANRPSQTHVRASDQVQSTDARETLQVVSEDLGNRGVEHLTGMDVRDANGKEVGTVEDFMLDLKTGNVAFVVVSSGGFIGVGETLRLVPFQAIKLAPSAEGFTTPVQQSNWSKLPAIDKQDFKAGRTNLTAEQRRELSEVWYGHLRGGAAAETAPSSRMSARDKDERDFGERMARASQLRGKSVRAENREIGEIDDVVIDFNRGSATALVAADPEFTGSDHDFLVPFGQLQIGAGQEASVATTLTRADFQRAQSTASQTADRISTTRDRQRGSSTSAAVDRELPVRADRDAVSGGAATRRQDDRLAPTGRSEPTTNVDPALESAARAVRQIWEAHPELAKLQLRAAPGNGKLILSGTVPNAELWERAKDTAEGVIRGIAIENRISISR